MMLPASWYIPWILCLLVRPGPIAAGPRYSSRLVSTKSGSIRGVIEELVSRHLEPVEVFRGVPYAAPPVGNLRYRPPQPHAPWKGTKLADAFGSVCPQQYPDVYNKTAALQVMDKGRYNFLRKFVPLLVNQSEDCLFLNLYVPASGNRGLEAPYGVLVFVHGESFEWGSGNPYDGGVLASYGHVIVVTLNYRLGILGFLRTKPKPSRLNDSGGNLGIRDLVLALQWLQANIEAFGGDPKRVTLMGHDTGASLVNFLLISPLAKDLFVRAILLSGSSLSPWATAHNPEALRRAVGLQTNCLHQDKPDEDISNCLRTISLQSLLQLQIEAPRFMPRFAPSIPVDEYTPDPTYVMERPSEVFTTRQLMLGVSTTESYGDFNAEDIQYGLEEEQRNKVLRTYIRNGYVYHLNEIFSAVRNEYTDWDKPIQHPINIRDSTLEALSDGHTVAPLIRVGYLHASHGASTYLFHFGYQAKESDYPQRLGSVRGEDLTYVLGLPLVGGQPHFPHNYSRQDQAVAETLLHLVTNFAKTGDPNEARPVPVDGARLEKPRYHGVTWDPYGINSQLYLSITSKPKMRSHYRGHKMALWLNLIPQLHQPGDEDVDMRHHHFLESEQFYYAGIIRPESYTRLPPPIHPNSLGNIECEPSYSIDNQILNINISEEEDIELLQHLTTRQYYSYTAALGITVGVGCLLLIINIFIFAGIFYHRDRDKKRHRRKSKCTSPSSESIPMSLRHSSAESSSKLSSPSDAHVIKVHELPPCYNSLPRGSTNRDVDKESRDKPNPPTRTCSTLSNTVKKRIQIQEISV